MASAAVVAAISTALAPYVAPVAASAAPSPTDTGSFRTADLAAFMATRTEHARADRSRGLYPPAPRHIRPAAVQVAVAPPVPPVQVASYQPRRRTPVPPKRRNGGAHYAPPPISGSGSAVVAYAESFLGVRYQMGGASRSGIDCSGLVMLVYARFGVRLEHKASSFYGVGRAVSRGELQPGDILILDHGGHAAIYIGAGLMIHAPHSGTVVQISPIWSFSAARRVL